MADTKVAYTMRVPIGVVGAISPFNFPLNLVAHKLAPAIAAGCPVVLKPAGSDAVQRDCVGVAADRGVRSAAVLPLGRHRSGLGRRQLSRRPRRHRAHHLHRLARGRLGHQVSAHLASTSGSSSATTPPSSSPRTATGEGRREDQDCRLLARRSVVHLDAAHPRPPQRRRRVHRATSRRW